MLALLGANMYCHEVRLIYVAVVFVCVWRVARCCVPLQGVSEGITQTTKRGNGPNKHFVWNFPIDINFKSTNPFGCE